MRASASVSAGSPSSLGMTSASASKKSVRVGEARDLGALDAFDQHLHGAVGQLEKLQHLGERADLVDRVGRRIVVGRILLRDEQNALLLAHHFLERADRLLAADEERHDHVRKNDDVAQRQNGKSFGSAGRSSAGMEVEVIVVSFRGLGHP